MERRRKITELRLLVLLITACFALQIHASSENVDVDAVTVLDPFHYSQCCIHSETQFMICRSFTSHLMSHLKVAGSFQARMNTKVR